MDVVGEALRGEVDGSWNGAFGGVAESECVGAARSCQGVGCDNVGIYLEPFFQTTWYSRLLVPVQMRSVDVKR